jgi:hypothetical protein
VRLYSIADRGLEVLDLVCQQLNELKVEVMNKKQELPKIYQQLTCHQKMNRNLPKLVLIVLALPLYANVRTVEVVSPEIRDIQDTTTQPAAL